MTKKNKPKGSTQNHPSTQHEVLVSKRTGKVSSSNNWLNALAARAVTNQSTSGIAALLPIAKAQKLLRKNELVTKTQRGLNNELASEQARDQAKQMIPMLAHEYGKQLASHKDPRRNDFCRWVVKAFQDIDSSASKYAIYKGYDELIDTEHSWRWWKDRLNKMQS